MRIGIVGLGLVGKALARRLIAAGHDVRGYDIAHVECRAAENAGVNILDDAQAVAKASDLLLLSLLTSENRHDLLWGPQALSAALAPGTVVLDTTTGRPEDTLRDAERLAALDVRLVDVCLSGSSQVIEEGRALALIGDRRGRAAAYAGIVAAFSKAQYYFDAPGQGSRVKLIVNLVFGLNRAVLAEALGLAAHAGFDLDAILDVLKQGETYSVAMDTKGPKMVAGVYEPAVARLGQHAKDVDLILEYAQSVGARASLSETHARLIREVVEAGDGHLDNAAIFKAYAPPRSRDIEKD